MKNHSSRKSNKKDVRFRTPSLYKANKSQFGKQSLGHMKGVYTGKKGSKF